MLPPKLLSLASPNARFVALPLQLMNTPQKMPIILICTQTGMRDDDIRRGYWVWNDGGEIGALDYLRRTLTHSLTGMKSDFRCALRWSGKPKVVQQCGDFEEESSWTSH